MTGVQTCALPICLDEAVEKRLGMDPQKHKEYLYHFYEGNFPGSWAKGELYLSLIHI